MYYKSNNAVSSQPYVWEIDAYKVKSIVTYAMNGFLERLENAFELTSGMKNGAIGYNSKKYGNCSAPC